MSEHDELPETVDAAAARWFARKRSGTMSAHEAEALEVWLARDPEHRAVFDQTEYWWGAASALRNDPGILAQLLAATDKFSESHETVAQA